MWGCGPLMAAGWMFFLAAISRTDKGGPIPLRGWILLVVIFAPVIAIGLSVARSYVAVTSTSVIVRNPVRLTVLPVETVDRFVIKRYGVLPSVCHTVTTDGREQPCVGVTGRDQTGQELVMTLTERLAQAKAPNSVGPRPEG